MQNKLDTNYVVDLLKFFPCYVSFIVTSMPLINIRSNLLIDWDNWFKSTTTGWFEEELDCDSVLFDRGWVALPAGFLSSSSYFPYDDWVSYYIYDYLDYYTGVYDGIGGLVLFRGSGMRIATAAFGAGTGAGMSIANCENLLQNAKLANRQKLASSLANRS